MKKIIMLITCIMLFSCVSENDRERIDSVKAARENCSNIIGNPGMIKEVYKFNYEGCDWISFEGSSRDAGFSVVHSPKCKNSVCPYIK